MERHSSVSFKIKGPKILILNFYAAPEECKRRIVKTEDDDLEAELTAKDISLDETFVDHSLGSGVEVENGGDGKKEKDIEIEKATVDGEKDSEPDDHDDFTSALADSDKPYVCDDKAGTNGVNAPSPHHLPTPTSCSTAPNTIASGGLAPLAITGPSMPLSLPSASTPAPEMFGNPFSPHHLPTPTSCSTAPNTIASGGLAPLAITGPSMPLSLPSASTPTPEMFGNPFALQQADPQAFHFPDESHLSGTHVQGASTFDPYSGNFTNNWPGSATPAHSATPSLNSSLGFWFGNGENNTSGRTFSQGAPILYGETTVY
jgi:hypothetical protein